MSSTEGLAALLAETRDDPRAFIELVLRATLRQWQAEVCEEIRRRLAAGERHIELLIRSCHGAGKTWFVAALSLWWTSTRPGCRGLTTAPTWAGVEGLLWVEIARAYRGSLLAAAGVGKLLQTSLELAPAWDLIGLSTDHPTNLEGRHGAAALRAIDECKAVEAGIIEATEGLLDAPETFDAWISTPSIASGPFFDRDMRAGERLIRKVVTIDDLIAEGLAGKSEWKRRRLEQWGEESPAYQARALARYVSDAEGALFPFAWVERAMEASFAVDLAPVAGLDCAGSIAGDESVLALVAGPDEAERYRVFSTTGWKVRDTQETKGRALRLAREAGAAVLRVDVVGLGKGIADSIRQDFKGVEEFRASDRPSDPERFTNRKAETAWTLRELLEAGRIRLPQSATLKAQLVAMRYRVDAQGRIRVVDPPDSPDHVDAVLIALADGDGVPPSARGWMEKVRRWERATAAEGAGAPVEKPSPLALAVAEFQKAELEYQDMVAPRKDAQPLTSRVACAACGEAWDQPHAAEDYRVRCACGEFVHFKASAPAAGGAA